MQKQSTSTHTTGRILHRAAGYDLIVWLMTRGRDRQFRERLLDLGRVQPGESVLDVGCGTGTLAIAAKRRVGPAGIVHGVDASSEMIARAVRKARKAALNVVFDQAAAEALPFHDGRFDIVLSTVMLHHLPKPARHQMFAEIRRVLKPSGRLLVVDFGPPSRRTLLSRLHRHGHTNVHEVIDLLTSVGLTIAESGPVGVKDLYLVLAQRPADDRIR